MVWLQAVVFAVVSAVFVAISWQALRRPNSHGFYRFFAWETMLALLVLNAPVWFDDRYAVHQQVSWVLLFTSLTVLCLGGYQLRRYGRPNAEQRTDAELYAFERTSQLVTSGIYSVIRHPLFCSLQLLTWGIACKQLNLPSVALALVASVLLYLAARRDEAECLAYFGDEYRAYMARSKMFVPFIF